MKFLSLILTFFLASFIISHAQDCKGLKTEKDSFTGQETKTIPCDFDLYYQATLLKAGEKVLMKNIIAIPALVDRPILPTDTLLMALENGHIVKLIPDKRYDGVYRATSYGQQTDFLPTYLISKENLQELSTSMIKKIRFTLTSTGDIVIKEKKAKRFMEAAKCML